MEPVTLTLAWILAASLVTGGTVGLLQIREQIRLRQRIKQLEEKVANKP